MKKTQIKKLDKLWSEKIRSKGFCEYCGRIDTLNAHHIFSRRSRPTRWRLDNGICLCASHHTFSSKFSAHLTPTEFTFWLIDYRGQKWYDDLQERFYTSNKQDYDEVRKGLE